ncbi:MAG: hypothetical protein K2Q14_04415, partial [Gammaproteobacteria bacterium]|nr:hypothetical protein [Gammaproteobacteria bacterium]
DQWTENIEKISTLCTQIQAHVGQDLEQLIEQLLKEQPYFKPFQNILKNLIKQPSVRALNTLKDALNTDLQKTNQKVDDLKTLTLDYAVHLNSQKNNLNLLNDKKDSTNTLWVQLLAPRPTPLLAQWKTNHQALKNYENEFRKNYKVLAQARDSWFLDYLRAVVSVIPALFNLGIHENLWRTKGLKFKDKAKEILGITPPMRTS